MQTQKPEQKNLDFFNDFKDQHKCFENEKVILMFAAMHEDIETTKNTMFNLNSYSNVANLKNTEMMAKNYAVFVFLLENLHLLKNIELQLFLSKFKWENECFIVDFFDYSIAKLHFLDCKDYDFTDEQLTIFN